MYRQVWPIRVFRCRDMKSDFENNVIVGELEDFSLDELSLKIKQWCKENKAENLAVLLKVPSDASEGVVYDIKQALREGYMLKLNLMNGF